MDSSKLKQKEDDKMPNNKQAKFDVFTIKEVIPVKTIQMPLMIGVKNGKPVFDDKLISILTPAFKEK